MTAATPIRKRPGAPKPTDVDRYVGQRLRDRRCKLGLSQQNLSAVIGVTYQQTHKYEKGVNRISAGRLYQLAKALGVDPGYFYEGLGEITNHLSDPERAMMLDLASNFLKLPPNHRKAVVDMARNLATADVTIFPKRTA